MPDHSSPDNSLKKTENMAMYGHVYHMEKCKYKTHSQWWLNSNRVITDSEVHDLPGFWARNNSPYKPPLSDRCRPPCLPGGGYDPSEMDNPEIKSTCEFLAFTWNYRKTVLQILSGSCDVACHFTLLLESETERCSTHHTSWLLGSHEEEQGALWDW